MRNQAMTAVGLLAFLAAGCMGPDPAEEAGEAPLCDSCDGLLGRQQAITVAFDGSRSIAMWRDSMAFAREIESTTGKTLHFTYFINTPYYLTDPPPNALGVGRGAIPPEEALRRWAYTQMAINEGHEIGSHLVGHYNGSDWSASRWRQEFDMFDEHARDRLFQPVLGSNGAPLFPRWSCSDPIATECDPVYPVLDDDGTVLFDAQGRASSAAIASGRLVPYVMVGVRAPELGWNNAMLDVMAERGFRYDTSQTGQRGWPARTRNGLWEFPVQMFPRTRSSRAILGMDYNFYVGHLTGAEVAEMYDRVVREAYEGSRHPVYFCHHFSRWEGPDGVTYWSALQGAIRAAARRADVIFPSYVELTALVEGGTTTTTTLPFVGTACEGHDDCMGLEGSFCATHGSGDRGFCSLGCDRYCPDRPGEAATFCVASSELEGLGLPGEDLSSLPAGVCVPKAEPANGRCAELPGTAPTTLGRFNDPSRTAEVCAPRS